MGEAPPHPAQSSQNPVLCLAAPHRPSAEVHACQEQHWHSCMHTPLAETLGSLTAGRIKPLPEELLHILGGRFQGNHLQSHKYPFLSCPTTDSTRLLIASADCRTPFVWILGLNSHWHSPTTSKSSGCMSAAPLNPGTWQGALCSAPEPSQGEAHRNTAQVVTRSPN